MNPQHEALKKFGYQIQYAVDHYQPHGLSVSNFNAVVIAGLGGSGIGGRIAKSLFQTDFPLPIECVSDYTLPAFVNQQTLVILSSYSGNTEETLAVFEEAKSKNCILLVLTSGGKLKHLSEEHKLLTYPIEGGFQPRMALGFSLTYLLMILAELSQKDIKPEFLALIEKFKDTNHFEEDASVLFNAVKAKTKSKFIVITDGSFEAVGIRFCQQVQENAKHECFNHVLPEMNHNVIESYYGQLDSVFFCVHSQISERVSSRFEFLNNLLEVEHNKVLNVVTDTFQISDVYETIHTLDWLSLYVADHRRVDSLNVPNISSLKEFLDQA